MLLENISVLLDDGSVRENMFLGIDGDRIDYLDSRPPERDYGEAMSGRNRLAMPGFFNAHAHSPMTMLRGYGENLKLHDWLNQKIFPFEDRMQREDVYYATLLAMAESFRYGIVSSTEMYFYAEDIARAVLDCGAKMNLCRALVSFDPEEEMRESRFFKEADALLRDYDGLGDGRLKVEMGLHAEFTSTEKLVEQLGEFLGETGAALHVHVSETKEEHEGCKSRHEGRTPVRYLADNGLFDVRATAAHCVWVEDEDMDILREKGVTVATCPISNLKLASGICKVPALWEKGINVAIGTDSVASNNSLNYLNDMKFFALVNKERRDDPTLITPHETLEAATWRGAQSQGREDCGRIVAGNKADLILLDTSAPNMHPVHDMETNIVYAASGGDVSMTIIDGRVVYEDGRWPTLDVERTIFMVNAAKERILATL